MMNKIKARDLEIDSIMVDTSKMTPVIRTEDVKYKQPIYLVSTTHFEYADEDDEITLGFSKITSGQIRSEKDNLLITVHGLKEKKKNLTVIE